MHRRITQHLDDRIDAFAAQAAHRTLRPRKIHHAIAPQIREAERAPHPRPLGGIRVDIEEQSFHRGRDRRGRMGLEYQCRITPNASGVRVYAVAPVSYTQPRANWNLAHVLLADADPPITSAADLGPYDLQTTPWNAAQGRPYGPPRFTVSPEQARWSRATSADHRWASLDRRTRYGVESYAWDNAQVGFNRSGRQAALINQRATNPTTGMRAWVVGAPRTDRTGRVVSALVRVNATASRPRPLQSLVTEERYWSEEEGAGGVFRDRAHGVSNHVLGTRTGVRNERELAWRAAFNEVHGDPRSKLNPPTDPATAFRSLAAAEDAVRGLHDAFQRGWNPANRDKIAASEQVTESAAVDGRRTIGFQVVPGVAARPAYLARAFSRRYGGAPWTGTRPLFPGDERSPEAQEWIRRGNTFTGPPLTTRVTMSGKNVTAYFKSVNRGASAAMGWYLKTFFPDGR